MPIALQPGGYFPVVLESDAEHPAPRPAFHVKHLTLGEWIGLEEVNDRIDALRDSPNATGRALVGAILDALVPLIAGWEGMATPCGEPIAFDAARAREQLADMLTLEELHELRFKALAGGGPTATERKKSESLPVSATDASAVSDAPATGNATIR